jgi:hypothetical protein
MRPEAKRITFTTLCGVSDPPGDFFEDQDGLPIKLIADEVGEQLEHHPRILDAERHWLHLPTNDGPQH